MNNESCMTRRERVCDTASPFQHLIDSASQLLEDTPVRHELNIYISHLRNELNEARIRAQCLRATLQKAEADCVFVQSILDAHVFIAPPIHYLPKELLERIFSLAMTGPIAVKPGGRQMPFKLAHVCRRWRLVAFGNARLWSSLVLDSQTFQLLLCPLRLQAARALKEFLSRSKESPLTIQFDDTVWPSSCLALVLGEAHRIQSLSLRGSYTQISKLGDFDILSNISHLDLAVEPTHDISKGVLTPLGGEFLDEPQSDPSRSAPRLTHLKLRLEGFPKLPRYIRLPYHSLTHLEYECAGCVRSGQPAYILNLLSFCPSLLSLKDHHKSRDYAPDSDIPQPVILPHLRELSLLVPSILHRLTCPSLVELEIFNPDNFGSNFAEILSSFLNRSQCHIDSLKTVLWVSDDGYRALLQLFPTISRLHLDLRYYADFGGETLASLFCLHSATKGGYTAIYPDLQCLSVTLRCTLTSLHPLVFEADTLKGPAETELITLVELIVRRPGSKLQLLQLRYCGFLQNGNYDPSCSTFGREEFPVDFWSRPFMERLRYLERNGLHVEFLSMEVLPA